MAVDEQRLRQSLHARLAEAVGADEAALLMEYLPPVGWADIARQSDLEANRVIFSTEIASVGTEIASLRSETTSGFDRVGIRIDTLRSQTLSLNGEARSEARADIAELKNQLLMWLLPTVIGSVGVAVTLARIV